jgi:hypothetical protein
MIATDLAAMTRELLAEARAIIARRGPPPPD